MTRMDSSFEARHPVLTGLLLAAALFCIFFAALIAEAFFAPGV